MSKATPAGTLRRGPWRALRAPSSGTWTVTCDTLPGWNQEVPQDANIGEVLYQLDRMFPEQAVEYRARINHKLMTDWSGGSR